MTRYDLAYLAVAPAAAGFVGYKYYRQGKYNQSLPAMFGASLAAEDPARWRNGSIWVHAVSVGEVIAAKAMLPLLRAEFPQYPILLTTHTETGQAQARTLEGNLADAVRYFPFDFSWVVRRFAETYRPRLFIPMETELWPNALNLLADSGAQTFVLNGKISESSFRSYTRFKPLLRTPLSRVAAYCMQTDADAERIRSLTDGASAVHVTGNCKFDTRIAPLPPEEAAQLRATYGISEDQPLVVVGSTHPSEEEIVLAAWKQILAQVPNALILLVPRHPERFAAVWSLLAESGISARRASDSATTSPQPPSIILVDQMGVLARLYALANVAIIAGSFVPGIGGHNLQEAAGHGVPVIYGPHMRSQPDMTRILTPENGGTIAADADTLARETIALLQEPELAQEKGALGREAFDRNRGSAQRNLEIIRQHYKS